MSNWFTTYGHAEVYPGLLAGAYPLDADDVSVLAGRGVERVLNLVEDAEYPAGARELVSAAYAAAGIEEVRLSLVDYGRLPADRVETGVDQVVGWLREPRRVYLHCRAGWQRSAAYAAGVVAVMEDLPVREALAYVHSRKPTADPLAHQRTDLELWWLDRVDAAPRRG